jgi:hypothetical protein
MKPSDEHADSVFYGIAVEEVQAGRVDKGLMAKAIAKAYGDKKKAEVLYLEWRVGLLKEEAVIELRQRDEEAKRREKEVAFEFQRKKEEEDSLRSQEEQKIRAEKAQEYMGLTESNAAKNVKLIIAGFFILPIIVVVTLVLVRIFE